MTTSRPFWNFDFAAIEARLTCWVCGQEDALEEYRQGVDRYKRMASVIYNVPEDRVSKHPQRFIGKQAILLCGFQGGAPKFRQTCEKFGYKDMPVGLEVKAVETFRRTHPMVKKSWWELDRAAKSAILHPDQVVTWRLLKFICKTIEGTPFLLIRLPSGRKLAYPRPKVVPSRKFENATTIQFFGHILGAKWGNVETYGGSILENIVQGIAADLMANGAHCTEKAGYEIATLIHDECLSYYHPERGQTAEEFEKLLTKLPSWASGLPLEAEGGLVPFYKKD